MAHRLGFPHRSTPLHSRSGYDPWRDLTENWPHVAIVIEHMRDGAVIALRAGTSAAQRRCTLTHEIVHLERGLPDCGQWEQREERSVHREVARRLIPLQGLASALRCHGGAEDLRAIAATLEVDLDTLRTRLSQLAAGERRTLHRLLAAQAELWSVA
jgi:predicted HD phosphohydrolase